MNYYFQHLRLNPYTRVDKLAENVQTYRIWGIFSGLFGLPNNEIFVVSAHPLAASNDHQLIDQQRWLPTARPASFEALSREGLYVFRYFVVAPEDVEELVQLSVAAWQTFENDGAYAAQPQGLFQPATPINGQVHMMLVTWYDGFESWQISRQPADGARQNFSRRQALTHSTSAVATRLVRI